ncbi:MAG: DNA polymerase III subunit alpha, partial [Acidobacteria bacterium]|nr:DNA polymerase III subunit alpha [Acidobacteriota bacterium]
DRLTDLIALNALYRPGPMKMIDDYIDRKHGRKQVTYDLPELKNVLEETFGVIVYQEQVMQISNLVAGYSLGDADILRRAMGKKKQEEMDAQRVRFLDGARKKNLNPKKAEKIFDLMAEFAKYGFNKSHSAAYAYLAYITAYLKAHYPVEFMSALLTSETGNTAKVVKYINECRDMGIKVLPPDINASALNFTPDQGSIRFGQGAIKNVGSNAVDAIVNARNEGGRFRTLADFCERVDMGSVNRRMIESFIKAGAMDSLEGTRAQLWAVIDRAMEAGQRVWKDKASGQVGLFGDLMIEDGAPEMELPKVQDWLPREKLTGEKEMIGFYVTGHPLDEYREKVADVATHDTSTTESLERGVEVAMCGVITGIQRRRNKEQKLWASFMLEDWVGTAECMAFAKVYESLLNDLVEDKAVLIRGMVLPEENAAPRISVQSITPLALVRQELPRLVSVRVFLNGKGNERAQALTELFARKQGEAQVRLRLEKPRDFALIMDLEAKVKPDKEFVAEIERICGPQSFEVLAS